MKKSIIHEILNAFSKIEQNILWKFEDENLQVPSNVMIMNWTAQADILAHPNIRLFITHAELLSITEAIYFGVPIIGMPIFADQHLNAAFATEHGYGVTLEYRSLTEEKLSCAIDLVLNNSRFQKSVTERSKMFHDLLSTSLEKAVHSVEYCINHHGCRHLRSPVLKLRCYQYLLLDVLFLVFIIILLLLLTLTIIWRIVRMLLGKFFLKSSVKDKKE